MDLYSNESKHIDNLVQNWINYPENELEATFGVGGEVDSTTFLNIAQRLRVKGFDVIPQDDRLSIITQNHIRLSLQGLGVLQQYCRDDKLVGKPFTAMIKDRTSQDDNIDLKEYSVRIKSRREIPLSRDDPRVKEIIDNWATQLKAFRLVRRWTFRSKGIRVDMSMVRSTPRNPNGNFKWVRSFTENNVLKEITHYEVEVELLRNEYTATKDQAIKSLIGGIGEILRAIQKNTLLIRKSIADKVRSEYSELIKAEKFRGVSPVTLEFINMTSDVQEDIPNIRSGYNVTDKADGLRCMGYCNSKGELFLIDMSLNIYRTGFRNKNCANSLVDGEWVTMGKDGRALNHYLIFDIYYDSDSENVSIMPFVDVTNPLHSGCRFNKIKEWYAKWNTDSEIIAKGINETNKMLFGLKEFQIGTPNNDSIFTACSRVLDTPRIYVTDGLIITSNTSPLPQRPGETFYEQFKWKPASQNTVDFLVNFERDPTLINIEKITTGIHPDTGETIRYKTLRLFVGSDKDPAFDDPRNTILFEQDIPKGKQSGSNRYKPVLFNPLEYPDTMANTCNLVVKFDSETGEEYVTTEDEHDGTSEPIRDKSIIEMRYEPKNEGGWRWIPIRVRHDKTERLQRGIIARTLNSEKVANSVWNSIHNPVTISMIRNGSEEPTEEEMKDIVKVRESEIAKKYYERKASEEDIMLVRGMLDFHNKYIKNDIIYKKLLKGGGKNVLDVACGKGGDLFKWIFGRARTVVGIDTAGENIRNTKDGAYKRYLESIIEFGKNRVPNIAFIIGNSARNIINGDSGSTPEERDMLRSIFGKVQPEGPVPKYIETTMAGSMRAGADLAVCMFAIHYFFENKETLDGLIKNISDTVKVGGYFAGCAFDGQKVFNLLRNVETGHSKIGKEGDTPIWTITKQYDKDELSAGDDSIGLAIDVEFISIGTTHREYLVPFELLKIKMAEIGFELLNSNELKEIGLNSSTNTFDVSYKMAENSGRKYVMTNSIKEFSFLNRWFIFRRKGIAAPVVIPEKIELPKEETVEEAKEEELIPKIVLNEEVKPEEMKGEEDEGEEEGEVNVGEIELKETGARLPAFDKKFSDVELFRFGPEVAGKNSLKIKDDMAVRWLSPSAPFPISDPDDPSIKYPSIEHYMAGMKLKKASNVPDLAVKLMSTNGSIHQGFLNKRRLEGGIKPESTRDYQLVNDEINEIKKKMTKTALLQYRATIDEIKWSMIKDDVLRTAIEYRWINDARFHTIVEAARNQGKYLLYSIKGSGANSELGGVRSVTTSQIVGENKVGRTIMEVAGFVF